MDGERHKHINISFTESPYLVMFTLSLATIYKETLNTPTNSVTWVYGRKKAYVLNMKPGLNKN